MYTVYTQGLIWLWAEPMARMAPVHGIETIYIWDSIVEIIVENLCATGWQLIINILDTVSLHKSRHTYLALVTLVTQC